MTPKQIERLRDALVRGDDIAVREVSAGTMRQIEEEADADYRAWVHRGQRGRRRRNDPTSLAGLAERARRQARRRDGRYLAAS